MNLNQWIKENTIANEMCWKGSAEASFPEMVSFAKTWAGEDAEIEVVSSHTSKSIKLPVIKVSGPSGTIYLRDNFHDVKISFECPDHINHDLFGITAGTHYYLNPVYFEGFEESWVYPGFVHGSKNFSVCIYYEKAKELAKAINAYFAKYQVDQLNTFEYNSVLVRQLKREENVALGYGLPFVKTGRLFRSFKPKDYSGGRYVDLPVQQTLLDFALSFEWSYGKYSTLSFPIIDFTQGIALPQEEWLRALAKVIETQRNINTGYLDKGARFNFVGIHNDLQILIDKIGLNKVFTPDKDQ